jgi:hypothetical protein
MHSGVRGDRTNPRISRHGRHGGFGKHRGEPVDHIEPLLDPTADILNDRFQILYRALRPDDHNPNFVAGECRFSGDKGHHDRQHQYNDRDDTDSAQTRQRSIEDSAHENGVRASKTDS